MASNFCIDCHTDEASGTKLLCNNCLGNVAGYVQELLDETREDCKIIMWHFCGRLGPEDLNRRLRDLRMADDDCKGIMVNLQDAEETMSWMAKHGGHETADALAGELAQERTRAAELAEFIRLAIFVTNVRIRRWRRRRED